MENTGLQLSDLKVNNLPELQGWKQKQEKLVSENPFVEITDNKSYEIACKSRTALLKGRTELERQDKLIASQLTSFRKDVKLETDNLIAITLPFEEKQQLEVKRYEGIKIAEKEEEARLEQLRIDGIKKRIDDFETKCFELIAKITFDNVAAVGDDINLLANEDFDYEEYDILFENTKARIQIQFDAKFLDVQEKENQRLENERLEKENLEAKRISELQSQRLSEILPYVAFGEAVDLTKLSDLSQEEYFDIFDAKKALFEADVKLKQEAQEKLDAENLELQNKAKADKEKIFEIRKNRLAEIGVVLNIEGVFCIPGYVMFISKELVFNADAIDFETIITDVKLLIEKTKSDAEEFEKQKAIDLKLSLEDAERLKKENKERVKRLQNDKAIISGSLEVYFADLHLQTDNEETKYFVEFANTEIQELKTRLLTKLKNL